MSSNETCGRDPAQLERLLQCDEESREFVEGSAHVETCAICQARLSELAADEPSWRLVREVLAQAGDKLELDHSTEPPSAILFDRQGASLVQAVVRDCLQPPSHPEMLGRLGRYEIERLIGSGGMGVVFKGYDTELNRPVAIKVLAPHLAGSATARRWFAREGRAAAAVMHEHVVAIHNVETDGPFPYLVMQYVPGQSLQARVDRQGPLAIKEILRIGVQIASGLAAAHAQGLVHRDIKPSNILLEETVERTLLTDFGLARIADDVSMTRTGIVAGTPHYMSPEQARGETVDPRSDLFSLGSVLYFMGTGRPPFRAERTLAVLSRICHDPHQPVWRINPELPDELSDLVDRLLAKNPRQRCGSAAEVEELLAGLLARRPSLSRHGGRRQTVRRWIRVHRRPVARTSWALAAVAAIGLVAGLAATGVLPGWSDRGAGAERNGSAAPSLQAEGAGKQTAGADRATDWSVLRQLSAAVLDAQTAEIENRLRQLEQDHPSQFMQGGQAVWPAEVGGIERELSRLEQPAESLPKANVEE
jgi:eukaryotic-like serine/threonine-protein kinase